MLVETTSNLDKGKHGLVKVGKEEIVNFLLKSLMF